jgi:hypothetical protein
MLCCLDDRDSISQAGSVGRRLSSNVHQSNRKDAPAPLRLLCSVPLRPCRDMLPPQLMSWSCLLLALAGGTLAVITHHAQHNAKGHLQSSSHRLLFFSLLYITNNTGNRLQLAASVGHFQYGLDGHRPTIFFSRNKPTTRYQSAVSTSDQRTATTGHNWSWATSSSAQARKDPQQRLEQEQEFSKSN